MRYIKVAGHRYRLAEEDDQTEKPAGDPCASPETDDPFVQLATTVLDSANISGTPIRVCQEADGTDVKVNVSSGWSGVEAVLTFDFSANQKLQELVLQMCGSSFVAHSGRFGGGKSLKMLLGALSVLHEADFKPQQADETVDSKKKTEYIEFLRHYVTELLLGAVELPTSGDASPYLDRKAFSEAIKQFAESGKYPKDRAEVMSEGALRLSDQDWKDYIVPLVQSQGKQYAATQDMINKAVSAIIPASENYTGGAQLVAYLDEGTMLVGIDVPKPAQFFSFVFEHATEQKQLKLLSAGLGLCGGTFLVTDPATAGKLVSAMVSLAILAGRTAQPSLSEPPKLVAKEWDRAKVEKALASGLAVWHGANNYVRLVWQGKSIGCWSAADWKEYQLDSVDSTLKLHLEKARKGKRAVLDIDKAGNVDLLDYDMRPVQTNIQSSIESKYKACPVR